MVCRFRNDFGSADIQFIGILKEKIREFFRDFPRGFARFFCGFLHFVVAVVGVRCKMTDVGYIHNAEQFISVETYYAAKSIHEDIRAHIAHVGA